MKLGLILVIVAVFLFGCVSSNPGGITSTDGSAENTSPADSGTFSIPIEKISTEAKWYEYETDGATVRFFAVKSSDGSVKVAFDACDVCFSSKKGYRQEGDTMVCNNCGNRYPISGLGIENKGFGCWPSYLPAEVIGDSLVIKKSDLEKGKSKFL